MIDRFSKKKYLEKIHKKEEKFFVASILDKASKFERENSFQITNFMNLNEIKLAKEALNYFNIDYFVYVINDNIERKNIMFIPNYLENMKDELYEKNVSCIEIIPQVKNKLKHKDFMGAIYNLSVEREYIGDIILIDDIAYFFTMKSFEKYFLENLLYVGSIKVVLNSINIFSEKIKKLSINFKENNYIVPSMRIDAVLSQIYGLSRSKTKEKIEKGHLYINDKEQYFPSAIVQSGDIVSFKKCGKFKICEKIRTTKSGNIVLHIKQYS